MSSNYKGVTREGNSWVMRFNVGGANIRTHHASERAAAIAYDRARVERGLEPRNILKRR